MTLDLKNQNFKKKIQKLFYHFILSIFVYLKPFEDFSFNHQKVAFLMSRLCV